MTMPAKTVVILCQTSISSTGIYDENWKVKVLMAKDTVMADKKFSHGKHETQEARRENDIYQLFDECSKNAGHKRFIPVKVFGLEHLPPAYKDIHIVKFVQTLADLTVRIEATAISNKRPRFWPDSDIPVQYPFKQNSTNKTMRFGTGRIQTLNKYTKDLKISCPCSECKKSGIASEYWAEIRIHTAAHTVFDDAEGENTSCTLFFDSDDNPKVVISKCYVEMSYADRDRSRLVFATCDPVLIRKVSKLLKKHYKLWRLLYKKYEHNQAKNKLTIIVSHPHGCAKRVTVGDWVGRYLFGKSSSIYTYDTNTCKGSSGAPVYRLGNGGWHERVHSGAQSPGVNYSSTGLGRPTFSEIHFHEMKNHFLDLFLFLFMFVLYIDIYHLTLSKLLPVVSFFKVQTIWDIMNFQDILWILIFFYFQNILQDFCQKMSISTSHSLANSFFLLLREDSYGNGQSQKHPFSRPCFLLFLVLLLYVHK